MPAGGFVFKPRPWRGIRKVSQPIEDTRGVLVGKTCVPGQLKHLAVPRSLGVGIGIAIGFDQPVSAGVWG